MDPLPSIFLILYVRAEECEVSILAQAPNGQEVHFAGALDRSWVGDQVELVVEWISSHATIIAACVAATLFGVAVRSNSVEQQTLFFFFFFFFEWVGLFLFATVFSTCLTE
jgi:hypothetical protein